jgi:hypothetical protein
MPLVDCCRQVILLGSFSDRDNDVNEMETTMSKRILAVLSAVAIAVALTQGVAKAVRASTTRTR